MSVFNPQPGDWVKVTAKVVEIHSNGVDLGLDLFSKTDQYVGFVRHDLCEPTDKPILDEPAEGSAVLLRVVPGPVVYQRLGDGHWYAAGPAADTPGLTWAGLNRRGDLQVIHHA